MKRILLALTVLTLSTQAVSAPSALPHLVSPMQISAIWIGGPTTAVPKVVGLEQLSTVRYKSACVYNDAGKNGTFNFETGDFTARAALDPTSAIYVASNQVPLTSGAWVRQGAERPNAQWFGASPSTTPIQNSAALQAWLDYLGATKGKGYLPKGVYSYDTGLRISSGEVGFQGDGRAASVLNYTSSQGDALTVGTGTQQDFPFVHLHDFQIRGNNAMTSGSGLKLEISTEVIVERLFITGTFNGILADNAHFYKLIDIRISALRPGGSGVHIYSTSASPASLECYLERVFVEGNTNPALAPTFGFHIQDSQALFMDSCTAFACFNGFQLDPAVTTNKIEHIFFVNCLSDLNHGTGVNFKTDAGEVIRRVSWIGGWVSSNGGDGILMDGFAIESITLDGIQIYNNGAGGIRARVASDLSIMGCKVLGNSTVVPGGFNGIEFGTPAGGSVQGGIVQGNRCGIGGGFGNQAAFGVFLHSFNARLIITGNDFAGNAIGGINTNVAASSIIKDNL